MKRAIPYTIIFLLLSFIVAMWLGYNADEPDLIDLDATTGIIMTDDIQTETKML